MTSGARQLTVPQVVCIILYRLEGSLYRQDSPKSLTFTQSYFESMRIFSGLRSRWAMLRERQQRREETIQLKQILICSGLTFPLAMIRSSSSPPWINSKMRQILLLEANTSFSLTMFGWEVIIRIDTSHFRFSSKSCCWIFSFSIIQN